MTEDLAKRLGRKYSPNPEDKGFLMRSVLPLEPSPRKWRYWWPHGWWGDQGQTPQCVAYSWLHWVEDGPVTHPYDSTVPSLNPKTLYDRAQRLDEWPGTDYDGTSVRAGAKVLQEERLIGTYRWAWNLDTAIQAILTTGPVVLGTWWYTGMFFPDSKGFINLSGQREGGHAYVLNGVNTERRIARIKNSWGRGWGRNGYAYLSFDDLERLIEEQGEVCLAQELTRRGT